MANRIGLRVARPKLDDPVDRGGYRLVDLATNRVLLGQQFESTLEEIEAYLRREGACTKTPLEFQENIVRQMAARRNYVLRKSRPKLYVKTAGTYQLLHTSDHTTPVFPDRNPTLAKMTAFLRTQPVDPARGYYKPRAERISHA